MTDAAAVKPLRWILNGPALQTFATDPVSVRYFAGSRPFVLQRSGDPVRVPAAWDALPTRAFTSYRAMKRAFDSGKIGAGVKAIIYDNEHWNFTPAEEQVRSGAYAQLAAALVHAHHMLLISTPATNLVRAAAPQEVDAGEARYAAFLRLGIAADHAKAADVIDLQAQGSERDTGKYAAFVKSAAAQARSANRHVLVLAGISTNPGGMRVTADDVLRAIHATQAYVDGYWFNVPRPSRYCPNCTEYRPDIALDVLRRLQTEAVHGHTAERSTNP